MVVKSSKPDNHKILKIGDVLELGRMLVDIADKYPLQYRTERDFFPLVEAYLVGRLPNVKVEHEVKYGRVDFRFGGTNPTLLELAVQPRRFIDMDNKSIKIAGHNQLNVIQASQNKTEIKKLRNAKAAKTRFLLLVDLVGKCNSKALLDGYRQIKNTSTKSHPVNVIYASRNKGIPNPKVRV